MFDSHAAAPHERVDLAGTPLTAKLPVSIRHAIESDGDELIALEQRAFTLDRLSPRQWRIHLDSDSAVVLVARQERRMAGSILLFFRRGSTLARIYSLAVDPEARGQGVGLALATAAEQAALKRGAQRMRLEVRDDNVAAQQLYLHLGYRRIGDRPGYYQDGALAQRYEKALV